jgi:hypothetical protein
MRIVQHDPLRGINKATNKERRSMPTHFLVTGKCDENVDFFKF